MENFAEIYKGSFNSGENVLKKEEDVPQNVTFAK